MHVLKKAQYFQFATNHLPYPRKERCNGNHITFL